MGTQRRSAIQQFAATSFAVLDVDVVQCAVGHLANGQSNVVGVGDGQMVEFDVGSSVDHKTSQKYGFFCRGRTTNVNVFGQKELPWGVSREKQGLAARKKMLPAAQLDVGDPYVLFVPTKMFEQVQAVGEIAAVQRAHVIVDLRRRYFSKGQFVTDDQGLTFAEVEVAGDVAPNGNGEVTHVSKSSCLPCVSAARPREHYLKLIHPLARATHDLDPSLLECRERSQLLK